MICGFFALLKKKIQKSNTCLPACERDRGEPRADWAALPCLSWELGQSCSRGAAPACKGLQEVQAGLSLAPGTWLIAHGHWSSKNSLFLFHSLQILTCLTTPSMKSCSWVLSIKKKKKAKVFIKKGFSFPEIIAVLKGQLHSSLNPSHSVPTWGWIP